MAKKTDTPSIDPEEIQIRKGGLRIGWKVCAAILAVLGVGGGGLAGAINVATSADLQTSEAAANSAAIERETKLQQLIEINIDGISQNREAVTGITSTVEAIRDVQIQQVASDEARRVTDDIQPRPKREREYDRLLMRNRERLKRGDEPCGSIDCD